MTSEGGEPLEPAGRRWPSFSARTVTVPARSSRAFDTSAWADALVVVRSGRIELETVSGAHRSFGAGDILSFDGLRLRALHNRRDDVVVLQVISRRKRPPDGVVR